MNNIMARYFTAEDFGVKPAPVVESEEVATAKKTLESTLVLKGDRFEVGLLWQSDQLRKRAKPARGAGKEAREAAGPSGLTPSELLRKDVFYVPHFIVESKKPRIVFDAAAQVRGASLNSQLLPGPDNLTLLFGVLIRCREQQIAVAKDIQEMFHRVKVRESDQHFQRVLWRDCESGRDPDVYVVQVLTFGATCSPSCAQAAKNRNAEELAGRYPLARDAIQRQHYVDVYIGSFANLETAKETVSQVVRAHEKGGFRIRNFITNNHQLLASIPQDRRQPSDTQLMLEEKTASFERILGVWVPRELSEGGPRHPPPTKREVLSFVMSVVFDPLGLISHVAIHGRILMREIHVAMEEWDELIPERLSGTWESFLRQLEILKGLTVPRCIKIHAAESIQLHTFVDASEVVAVCVYVGSAASGQRFVQLIAAKCGSPPSPRTTSDVGRPRRGPSPRTSRRRLIRHIAYLKSVRFLRVRGSGATFHKHFSVADLDEAREAMYRKAQRDVYAEEIAAIREQGHVAKGSSVASLNPFLDCLSPFLDERGVMRACGTLENASALGRDARTPILLPQKHKVTKLLVREYHERGLHQGDNAIIAAATVHQAGRTQGPGCLRRCPALVRHSLPHVGVAPGGVPPFTRPIPLYRQHPAP
ncbi:hypothetical protein AND_000862 [Anopheles darlingi]|uniref:Uncharacterized protein n=1 Tax=Anopheles darlingi TaxID=43151 RepID=W5JSI0_ANODA|nr:hypothetical protein AND_000862 [Anopheles darlingi]